jgi:hypothetical protein
MIKTPTMRVASGLALVVLLSSCGGHDSKSTTTTPPVATVAKTDVSPCLNQKVAGRSVQSLVIPDVVSLDLTQASGFPNGRQLTDPVIDLTLNAIFLDLSKVPVTTLANVPLDPSGNDVPYPGTFPYLAPAQGTAPAAVAGSGFVFRTNDASTYTRVDRMGEPAVSTALIATAMKTAYNDDSPTQDAAGKWAPTIIADLTGLTDALRDDFQAKGLPLCAVQTTG